MAHLVTGYAGSEHITSADDGAFNAAFFGDGQFVMSSGNKFKAEIVDNNTVRILDGDLLMSGRHVRIERNAYEELTIATGTATSKRRDLICMTYSKDASTGVESAYLEVIKGMASATNPPTPTCNTASILNGATKSQMPLYVVEINGVTLSAVTAVFDTQETYMEMFNRNYEDFKEACETHLDSLDVLDSMDAVRSNTSANQLAGALALKELATAKRITNLNVREDGLYSFESAASNKPVATEGFMWVCNSANGEGGQLAIFTSAGKPLYTRKFTSTTFGTWERYAQGSEIETLSNLISNLANDLQVFEGETKGDLSTINRNLEMTAGELGTLKTAMKADEHIFSSGQDYFRNASVRCTGGVKRLFIGTLKSSAAMTAHETYNVYTFLDPLYWPEREVDKIVCVAADISETVMARVIINVQGNVRVIPFDNRDADTEMNIDITYI